MLRDLDWWPATSNDLEVAENAVNVHAFLSVIQSIYIFQEPLYPVVGQVSGRNLGAKDVGRISVCDCLDRECTAPSLFRFPAN